MRKKLEKPLTNEAGEVRELTRADIRRFRPPADVLPADLVTVLPKRKPGERGPQKAPTKEQVTLRLDHDVLEHFKATGAGWQTRINRTLRDAIKGG
ncbi:MAG: BrnA antitoxin family protein [Candidatus Lambdaproteobacteria bacterium]|nr:BrnA antitoxin family protein [Candidatus Lambdaproteobacteria bacterium]